MDYRRQQNDLEREWLVARRDAFRRLPASEQHRLVSRVVEKAFAGSQSAGQAGDSTQHQGRVAGWNRHRAAGAEPVLVRLQARSGGECGVLALMAMRAGYDVFYRNAEAKMWCRPPREVDP